MKEKKGITLIALVITIIVLLILAGISIRLIVGDNGITQKTNYSKRATEEAEAMECIKMEVSGSFGIDGIYNTNLAKQNILNNLKPTPKVNPPLGEEKDVNSPFEVYIRDIK